MAGEEGRSHRSGCGVSSVQYLRLKSLLTCACSGLISYRELTQQGFEVDLYERDSVAGGNWHYTEEAPLDAPIPNAPIAVGDYEPSLPREGVTFPYTREWKTDEKTASFYRRAHRGPKPIWASLKSNAPAVSPHRIPWLHLTHIATASSTDKGDTLAERH